MFGINHNKYAFILGHVPALSRLEIIKVLEDEDIKFTEILLNKEVLVIEVKGKLDVNNLQERLGGTVKISRITYHVSRINFLETIEKVIKDLRPKIKDQRYQFGFSAYGDANLKELQKVGLSIKRGLKEKGIKSRFVVSKDKALSSVIVKKEQLIEKGIDVVIIRDNGQCYLGYTLTVQGFEEYSERDYGRPTRDDKSGMLPPKLAKIMLNISQADYQQVLLDPFCGSGTIIQEALLLGYKNIIASDVSQQAVEFTQNNIDWLRTRYGINISGVRVYQLDARELTDVIKEGSVDVIVTEPYLGPSQNLKLKIKNLISKLSDLYIKSFEEFYKVLKNDGKVVIILPIINGQLMDVLEQIKSIGFKVEPLSEESRGSIIYSRAGARVMREIFLFYKVV